MSKLTPQEMFDNMIKSYLDNVLSKKDGVSELEVRFGTRNIISITKNNYDNITYSACAINWASLNGHIHILDWFKNNDYEIKYTENAINWASQHGHIHILNWFKNNGYQMQYIMHH